MSVTGLSVRECAALSVSVIMKIHTHKRIKPMTCPVRFTISIAPSGRAVCNCIHRGLIGEGSIRVTSFVSVEGRELENHHAPGCISQTLALQAVKMYATVPGMDQLKVADRTSAIEMLTQRSQGKEGTLSCGSKPASRKRKLTEMQQVLQPSICIRPSFTVNAAGLVGLNLTLHMQGVSIDTLTRKVKEKAVETGASFSYACFIVGLVAKVHCDLDYITEKTVQYLTVLRDHTDIPREDMEEADQLTKAVNQINSWTSSLLTHRTEITP